MDEPKPSTKEYHEGKQAARQFESLVKRAVTVSPEEIKRRDEEWKKERKAHNKRTRV